MAGEGVKLLRRAIVSGHRRNHSLIKLSNVKIEEDLAYLLLSLTNRPLLGLARPPRSVEPVGCRIFMTADAATVRVHPR